jgi:hypothetical protein
MVLVLAVGLVGCQGGIARALKAPSTPLTVSTVVVYPVRLTGTPSPGWREFELGQRLVDVGLASHGGRLAFFGPSEFRVSRWEQPSWTASTVVPQLFRAGRRPDETLVLRATAEKRVATSAMERRDAKGLAEDGVVAEEVTWVCAVELVRPSTGEVLGEVTGQVTVDPFTPTGEEEFDPDAPMTHLLERLTLEARRWSAKALPDDAPDVGAPGIRLAMSPAVTAAEADTGLTAMDALARKVWVQNRARFLTPTLSEAQLSTVSRLPLGLLVLDASKGAGVEPGDVILRVDGEPPLPRVLYRKRLRGGGVPVTVKRGGVERDALIP